MSVLRPTVRAARRFYVTRAFGRPADISGEEFITIRRATEHHAEATTDLWRRISFYLCFPTILAGGIYVAKVEAAHNAHLEHERHENGGKLPEGPPYSYLNHRVKPFPWGNNSLFFNPEVNKDMNE